MNLENALKRHLPGVWFRFKFLKYKYLKRGEAELWLLRHLVEPGTTAIDIGASIGMYAHELSGYALKVMAFEANPAVAAFARSVAAPNVEIINAALSSAPGRATLTIPLNHKGHGITELATIAPDNPMKQLDAENVEVVVHRLDDFPISNCGFVKIDVEGHEEAVLDGATKLIATQRPVLMVELNETFNPGGLARVTARYAALAYGGWFLSHGRLRPIAEFDPARDQNEALSNIPRRKFPPGAEYINNFVFIPEERRERVMARLS